MIGRYERSRYRQKYRRLGLLMDDALTIYPLVLLRFNSRALLEFTILTAACSGKVWTVPAARMKGGREHRVALSRRGAGDSRKAQYGADQQVRFHGTTAWHAAERNGHGNDFAPHENRQRDGSRPHSATGAARYRRFRAKLPRLRLLTLLAIRRSAPIAVAMRWKSDAHLWRPGQPGAGERRATSFRLGAGRTEILVG
jgi:hypothetical protein